MNKDLQWDQYERRLCSGIITDSESNIILPIVTTNCPQLPDISSLKRGEVSLRRSGMFDQTNK